MIVARGQQQLLRLGMWLSMGGPTSVKKTLMNPNFCILVPSLGLPKATARVGLALPWERKKALRRDQGR